MNNKTASTSNIDLTKLIKSIDIVEFLSQFVNLEQKGDEFWGLSCFKDEKTPSFSVRRHPPVFYDYSSGIGGNVFTFVKHYYNCTSSEAVQKLVEYAGIGCDVMPLNEKMASTLVFKKYQKQYHTEKQSSATILPDDYMLRYEKRDDKLKQWKDEGISDESLERFQVFYDSFSDRLVYPIRNVDGKIVNIGGRTLDPHWKENKQKKYCYFYSWGTMDTIYGLSENMEYIKQSKEVILFEGCKSVLIADTWGIKNTGALLTSHLNPHQMKILAKLGCKVVFALDKDVDIRKDHNISKLKQYVNVQYVIDRNDALGEKDSPVDRGEAVFRELYDNRISLK